MTSLIMLTATAKHAAAKNGMNSWEVVFLKLGTGAKGLRKHTSRPSMLLGYTDFIFDN